MRASSRPLAVLCPSSAEPSEFKIEEAKDAADMGTAAHLMMARIISGDFELGEDGDVDAELTAIIARTHSVDELELATLVRAGLRRWNAIKPQDGAWRITEAHFSSLDLDGALDVVWQDDSGFTVVDWKFGREMRDHYHQLAQYAWLVRSHMKTENFWTDGMRVHARIEYVRLGKTESYEFGDTELDEWFCFVTNREQESGKTYNPGEHCGFCPHAHTCYPRAMVVRSSCSALAHLDHSEITPSVVGNLYPQYKILKRAMAAYESTLDEMLDAGVAVPLGAGYSLKRDVQLIDAIDPRAAWPVLTDAGFSQEEMAKVVSMSKGAIESIVVSKAKKRGGAAAMRIMMEKLNAAGAVDKKERRTKVEVKDGE